ncbi:class Ib ribonucleoside-diphosphate reductase assembly flavoprotein NrdI [Alkalihalobacillus sp. NPDC078783]
MIYDSMTGNVERFVSNLSGRYNHNMMDIKDVGTDISEDFILVTHTIGFGEVPTRTRELLEKYSSHALGVAVSGNKLWGNNYGRAGKLIQEQFKIPLLMTFEMSGMESDIKKFEQEVDRICQ